MIVAVEYGRALYALAKETGETQEYLQTLSQIDALLNANPAYGKLLDTPAITTEEKLGLIDEAFSGCEQNILNFMKILCEKHAVCDLHACVKAYEALYDEEHGITEATCKTARPLSEEQVRALTEKLCTVYKKQVRLTCSVDPDLIGGIVLLVDGKQIDGSVRARLDTFRASLAETIV